MRFKDESGRLVLSRTAVSELGARPDLSEYEIAYLFVDGIAELLRAGAKREPVLAAWGRTVEGRRVLLHVVAGSKEDAETVMAFFEDMKLRGLSDAMLVTSDGAPGIIKACVCWSMNAGASRSSECLRRTRGLEVDVRCPDARCRAFAFGQGH